MARTAIVNFNAPELNQLALYLAERGELHSFVRPYLNKGRAWERMLEALPWLGARYASTFGRRRFESAALLEATHEAGVLADFAAAAVLRTPRLPPAVRQRWRQSLYESIRLDVRRAARHHVAGVDHVIAYPGFGRDAFEAVHASGGLRVVSYPIAHHHHHIAVREQELALEPEFASTWPVLENFTPPFLAELDAELDAADLVIVGSEFVARTFESVGVPARKVAVVPYGVDLGTFGPGPARPARDLFRVVFVGQIGQRKGLSYLLKGYREFARHDSRLLLIGHHVGSQAPLAPYRDLFEHVPHLTRPKLAETLRSCDVFVFPTLIEGMPLVVLEAMACGLPVVATANGPDQVVRDGIDGFIVPSRDPAAIAERLERLYRDPSLRERMGRSAAQRAGEFTWSRWSQGVSERLQQARAA